MVLLCRYMTITPKCITFLCFPSLNAQPYTSIFPPSTLTVGYVTAVVVQFTTAVTLTLTGGLAMVRQNN